MNLMRKIHVLSSVYYLGVTFLDLTTGEICKRVCDDYILDNKNYRAKLHHELDIWLDQILSYPDTYARQNNTLMFQLLDKYQELDIPF